MDRHEYEKMYRTEKTYFWFVAKQRLIERLAAKYTANDDKIILLDIGCGTGANLESLGRFRDAWGLDHSEPALECCTRRGLTRLVRGSAGKLPLEDDTFELACLLDIIEHLPDDMAALAEAYRVLTPGGCLLVTVPAYPLLWGSHDRAMGHIRRYRKTDLAHMLRGSGFELVRLTHFMGLLFPLLLPVRLLQKRLGSDTRTISYDLPDPLNRLLMRITDIERRLLDRLDMPFGTSLVAVCRKLQKSG